MYVLLILMILLLVAAIVYVGLRAIRWLRTMFDFRRTYVLWTVLVLLPLLFVVGDFLPASGFARAVTLTGGVSIGAVSVRAAVHGCGRLAGAAAASDAAFPTARLPQPENAARCRLRRAGAERMRFGLRRRQCCDD